MVDLAKLRKKAQKKKDELLDVLSGAAATVIPAQIEVAPDLEPLETPADPVQEIEIADASPRAKENDSVGPSARLESFKKNLGQRRSVGAIRGTGEEAAGEAGRELLVFSMAGEQYSVEIEKIVEIVTPRNATRVPNAGDSVIGIISLRGTIVTILDLRRKLGHQSRAEVTSDSRIVVVENAGETAGFLVDRVFRVAKIDAALINAHPVATSTEQSEMIHGVFYYAEKLTILLDLEMLLHE